VYDGCEVQPWLVTCPSHPDVAGEGAQASLYHFSSSPVLPLLPPPNRATIQLKFARASDVFHQHCPSSYIKQLSNQDIPPLSCNPTISTQSACRRHSLGSASGTQPTPASRTSRAPGTTTLELRAPAHQSAFPTKIAPSSTSMHRGTCPKLVLSNHSLRSRSTGTYMPLRRHNDPGGRVRVNRNTRIPSVKSL
jgi:hypothetical protein